MTGRKGQNTYERKSYIYRDAGCRKKYGRYCSCQEAWKNFIDSDLLIQEQEGKLLREIIAEVGDDGFLKIENQVNRDIQCEQR